MKTFIYFIVLNVLSLSILFADSAYVSMSSDVEGLYYARARYYDTQTGTFLTKDPLGIQAGVNTYLYVSANPVNEIDPAGLDSIEIRGKVVQSSYVHLYAVLLDDNGTPKMGAAAYPQSQGLAVVGCVLPPHKSSESLRVFCCSPWVDS